MMSLATRSGRLWAWVCVALVWVGGMTSGAASGAEVRIAFSKYTPPYVFEDGSGIVVDIVRMALESGGYSVTPV